MAGSLTVSALPTNFIPKILSQKISKLNEIKIRELNKRSPFSFSHKFGINIGKKNSSRLFAGLTEVEPDLNEDPKDRWRTNGIDEEDFVYGKYDDHHTYFEGDKKATFWESVAEDYAAIGPPTGFQGLISWLFLPAIAAGMYFDAPGEYLYIGAAILHDEEK